MSEGGEPLNMYPKKKKKKEKNNNKKATKTEKKEEEMYIKKHLKIKFICAVIFYYNP
jgi:hypothetical protein